MKKQAEKIQGKIILHLLNSKNVFIPSGLNSHFLCPIRIIYRYLQDKKNEYHLLNQELDFL